MITADDVIAKLSQVHGVTREPGRVLRSLESRAFEVIERRVPRRGELFADGRGADAWVYTAVGDHVGPQLIVRPV